METVNHLKCRRLQEIPAKYKCPECSKVLKTISGFLGHVKNHHNIDARATDNKVTTIVNKSENTFSCQDDHFSQIFPTAYQSSLKNIANDLFLPNEKWVILV